MRDLGREPLHWPLRRLEQRRPLPRRIDGQARRPRRSPPPIRPPPRTHTNRTRPRSPHRLVVKPGRQPAPAQTRPIRAGRRPGRPTNPETARRELEQLHRRLPRRHLHPPPRTRRTRPTPALLPTSHHSTRPRPHPLPPRRHSTRKPDRPPRQRPHNTRSKDRTRPPARLPTNRRQHRPLPPLARPRDPDRAEKRLAQRRPPHRRHHLHPNRPTHHHP